MAGLGLKILGLDRGIRKSKNSFSWLDAKELGFVISEELLGFEA